MPLRFSRPAMVPAAIGLAVACVVLGSAPTLADQVQHEQWWLRALHVTQAWQTTEGSGVTVAVLDTGADAAQPDLSGSVLPGPDFTHSGETAASPYFDGHGTAVASLIAGHGHGSGKSSGVIGVAPGARILSVRVTLGDGDPLLANSRIAAALPAAIAAGIRYAAQQGAQVIDLPLDPGQADAAGSPGATQAAGGSAAEKSAIAYALGKGAVVVAPAGDDGAAGNAVNYPAAYPGVISVGAFNNAFIKSPFSIRQSYVSLTAAGEGVIAAKMPSGYASMSSTSAASAMVAGMAALIKAQFPDLTPAQVAQALENGTVFRPAGKTGTGSGAGTADAAKALTVAATLAGPGARRAGTGAVPRVLPTPPPLPTVRQSLSSARLEKDGLISGGVLILLLLPIIALAVVRRRRRGEMPASGEPDWPERERYSKAAASRTEPQLGYLPAPAARALQAPAPAAGPHRHTAAGLRAAGREHSAAWGGSARSGSAGRGSTERQPPWDDAGAGVTAGRDAVWGAVESGQPAGGAAAGPVPAWGGSAEPDSVWDESARRAAAERDSVWGDSAGRGAAGRGSAGNGTATRDSASVEAAGRESAGRATGERNAVGRDAAGRDSVWGDSTDSESVRRAAALSETLRRGRTGSGQPGGTGSGQPGGHPGPGDVDATASARSADSEDFAGFSSFARREGLAGSDPFASSGGFHGAGENGGFTAPGQNGGSGSFPGPGENGGSGSFAAPGSGAFPASRTGGSGGFASSGRPAGSDDFAGFESLAEPGGLTGSTASADADAASGSGSFPGRPAAGSTGQGRPGDPAGYGGQGSPGDPGATGDADGPTVFDIGQGGFSGSSSFTGLSPKSAATARPSAAGQVPGPLLAPATRPASSRAAKVSGSPPWEPAVKPDSELPWTSAPAPQPGGGRDTPARERAASRSVWDTAAHGPGAGRAGQAGGTANRAARGGEAADDDADAQIYVWNPGATTEAFPTVPRDEDGPNPAPDS